MLKIASLLAVSLLITACGKLPAAYIGIYKDESKQALLEIQPSNWSLKISDKLVMNAKVEIINVEELKNGQAGVIVSQHEGNSQENNSVVYFIKPFIETKKTIAGIIYYETEFAFSEVQPAANNQAVNSIDMLYCRHGVVLINAATNKWELTCPLFPRTFHFKRMN